MRTAVARLREEVEALRAIVIANLAPGGAWPGAMTAAVEASVDDELEAPRTALAT